MGKHTGSVVRKVPRFSQRDARRVARTEFGVDAQTAPLASERDQNFLLSTANGERFVLKIANAGETRDVLDLQNRAMEHVARHWPESEGTPCPRVRFSTAGEAIVSVESSTGLRHFVRLLTWVSGEPLADVRPHDRALLSDLGAYFANLHLSLVGFDHPAADRDFHWDLKNASRVVKECKGEIEDATRQTIVERLLDRFERQTAPKLTSLPTAVIHGDGNDHNVMVRYSGPGSRPVVGVIDFGDMVRGYAVAEPAIVAAYAMLHKADPLAAAVHVTAGYHAVRRLNEQEIAVLYPLICMRLAMSVSLAARQKRHAPGNEYLTVSEAPVWALLERLEALDPDFAEYALRGACGLTPCIRTGPVVSWLKGNRASFGPIVSVDPSSAKTVTFDLSVDGLELDEPRALDDTAAFTEALFGRMDRAGARIGLGRYDEVRRCYAGDRFRTSSDGFPERRTVHLGIDLFMTAGTPILAPLDGTIHSFQDNDARLDYGPTILLRHDPSGCPEPFYTLYGHLSRSSLDGLTPGERIGRGERVGEIGDPPTNGDWPPHLHFQLITHLLGHSGNYPGVAAPSQREIWLSLCPDPNLILRIPADRLPTDERGRATILADRAKLLGPSLSLAYRTPLQIVCGDRQYLYDENGQAFLDAVNNVSHVGHCHPHVVRAARRQMAVLNTNTRYLNQALVSYAKRLQARMPESLAICVFVCSGSEANELALRMARAFTGRDGVITVDGAYHGNTQALVDISPYKFAGPGGAGAPVWVETGALPDVYRGPYRGEGAGLRYAAHIGDAARLLTQRGHAPAAFVCESLPGCAGQIVPPQGYMPEAFEQARRAGAVCIADEVQVGFGRVGTHFWGFEAQGAVPDIVTLGKPIGNGHPLGAVVARSEIADAFANGMEYFNTFGGNPVSCAVGAAVLDVIEQEQLQENARLVGGKLKDALADLMSEHPIIGDVRGLGLFLGVELVLDRETLEPASERAAHVVERMKDHGVLISTDGMLRNVLKIKPPLVFDEENADYLVRTLDRVLRETALRI